MDYKWNKRKREDETGEEGEKEEKEEEELNARGQARGTKAVKDRQS